MPKPIDPYWLKERVFIERINLVELPASTKDPLGKLRLELKVRSLDDQALWQCFEAHRSELEVALAEEVKRTARGRIEISGLSFSRGSISIVVILTATSAALAPYVPIFSLIGLIFAAVAFIANYPALKRGARELAEDVTRAIESVEELLRDMFRSWFGTDGLYPA